MVEHSSPAPRPPSTGVGGLLARSLTESGRWQHGVETAVSLLDVCDHASVTVLTPHYAETVAVSDDVARRGDAWQHELSEGPGLASVRHQVPVVSQDLEADLRWRGWARRAVERLGFRSVVSLPLGSDGGRVGALNLYADRAQVWDAEQRALAEALAVQVAAAAAHGRVVDVQAATVRSRVGLGQAQGMVMERFGMTAEEAFDHLQRIAAESGVGLPHVVEHLVRTRDLPGRRTG